MEEVEDRGPAFHESSSSILIDERRGALQVLEIHGSQRSLAERLPFRDPQSASYMALPRLSAGSPSRMVNVKNLRKFFARKRG